MPFAIIRVEITWQTSKGEEKKTEAKCGMNLMRVAHAHGIDLEGEPPSLRPSLLCN